MSFSTSVGYITRLQITLPGGAQKSPYIAVGVKTETSANDFLVAYNESFGSSDLLREAYYTKRRVSVEHNENNEITAVWLQD